MVVPNTCPIESMKRNSQVLSVSQSQPSIDFSTIDEIHSNRGAMGLLDKVLRKQETIGSERYVLVLNQIRSDFEAELAEIQCNEGTGYLHVGFVLKTSFGEAMYFHRCRNTWLGRDGNQFVPSIPLGPVPLTSDPVQALEPVLSAIAFLEAES